jgi:hypothetical protein
MAHSSCRAHASPPPPDPRGPHHTTGGWHTMGLTRILAAALHHAPHPPHIRARAGPWRVPAARRVTAGGRRPGIAARGLARFVRRRPARGAGVARRGGLPAAQAAHVRRPAAAGGRGAAGSVTGGSTGLRGPGRARGGCGAARRCSVMAARGHVPWMVCHGGSSGCRAGPRATAGPGPGGCWCAARGWCRPLRYTCIV